MDFVLDVLYFCALGLGSWLLGVPIHDDSVLTCVYIIGLV